MAYCVLRLLIKEVGHRKMAVNKISPQQAFEWLSSGDAFLIDVREADEFRQEHIAYAASLPLSDVKELLTQLQVPRDRKIIFQCFKGTRGQQACVVANEGVFSEYDTYNIDGGITSWKADGLPVVGGTINSGGFSIFRQVQMVVGSLVFLLIMMGLLSGVTVLFIIAAIIGAALAFAGYSGNCLLAAILGKMPWNNQP